MRSFVVAGLSGKERFRGWFLSIFTILSARRVSGVFIFAVFAANAFDGFLLRCHIVEYNRCVLRSNFDLFGSLCCVDE